MDRLKNKKDSAHHFLLKINNKQNHIFITTLQIKSLIMSSLTETASIKVININFIIRTFLSHNIVSLDVVIFKSVNILPNIHYITSHYSI